MDKSRFQFRSNGSGLAAKRLMRAAALALAIALAMPAGAAENRAVKLRTQPVYPEVARRMRISGEVQLELTVDPEGKVTAVKRLSGNSMLSAAAEEAVRKWKFEPGPDTSTVDVMLNFAPAQ